MVKSLVENYFLYYKIACQNARNGISDLLDFEFFLGGMPQTPQKHRAYGTRFASRLLLYLSRLLQNVLRTLTSIFAERMYIYHSQTFYAVVVSLHL